MKCSLWQRGSIKVPTHSHVFHTRCRLENLCADDLLFITDSIEELQEKLILWKFSITEIGLWVNMGKTKVLISVWGLDVLQMFGKDPCVVCLSCVGANFILYKGYPRWIHKRCNGISRILKPDLTFMCKGIQDWPDQYMAEVTVHAEKLELVPSFCHLVDTVSSVGSCELATITKWRRCSFSTWGRWALRTHWLRWHNHVERSDGWPKKVQKLNHVGSRSHEYPRKTCSEVVPWAADGPDQTPTIWLDRLEWYTWSCQ